MVTWSRVIGPSLENSLGALPPSSERASSSMRRGASTVSSFTRRRRSLSGRSLLVSVSGSSNGAVSSASASVVALFHERVLLFSLDPTDDTTTCGPSSTARLSELNEA
eukprot:scaffold239087_cov24-Tisochrysis_lutea.AAC.3